MILQLNSPALNTVVVAIKIQGRLFLTEFSFSVGSFSFLFCFSLSLVVCRAFCFEK